MRSILTLKLVFLSLFLNAQGLNWVNQIGGTGYEEAYSVAFGSDNSVYVTGNFSGTVDFDPSTVIVNLTSTSGTDIFVAKYSSSGSLIWAKSCEGGGNDVSNSIAIDSNDNFCITGYFLGTVDFDFSGSMYNLTSNGNLDIFLAKYDSSGTLLWANNFGGTGSGADYGKIIEFDNNDNIILAGDFYDPMDIDPSINNQILTSNGLYDFFISKFDSNGNLIWANSFGDLNIDRVYGLDIDVDNNIIIGGAFQSSVDFDPTLSNNILTAINGSDAYFVKFDTNGNLIWAKQLGGSGQEIVNSLNISKNGNINLTGWFESTVDFDPNGGTSNLTSNGNHDIYFASYEPNGDLFWTKSFGSIDSDQSRSVISDCKSNIIITGYYQHTVDFDPGASISNLSSLNLEEIFVAKYDSLGNYLWSSSYDGNDSEYSEFINIDKNGDIFVLGTFRDTVDFDSGSGSFNLFGNGATDAFVMKLDGENCKSVSVHENKFDINFSIFPNPAYDYIYLYSENIIESSLNLVIFDISGKIVFSELNSDGRIFLGNFNQGMYYMKINYGDIVINKKFEIIR